MSSFEDDIKLFRCRAKSYRWWAWFFLLLIGLILSGAGLLSYYAREIAQSDIDHNLNFQKSKYLSELEELKKREQSIINLLTLVNYEDVFQLAKRNNDCVMSGIDKHVINVELSSRKYLHFYKVEISELQNSGDVLRFQTVLNDESGAEHTEHASSQWYSEAKKCHGIFSQEISKVSQSPEMKDNERYIEQLLGVRDEIAEKEEMISLIREQEKRQRAFGFQPIETDLEMVQEAGRKLDWAKLVQTNLTRFGSLFFALFLAIVLIPQYRYNIRLSAFYDARADALRIRSHTAGLAQFPDLISALTPNIGFGQQKEISPDQLANALREVIRTVSR